MTMTPASYRATLERLGLNQSSAAPLLGINARTSRRYAEKGPSAQAALLLAYFERYGLELAQEIIEKP